MLIPQPSAKRRCLSLTSAAQRATGSTMDGRRGRRGPLHCVQKGGLAHRSCSGEQDGGSGWYGSLY